MVPMMSFITVRILKENMFSLIMTNTQCEFLFWLKNSWYIWIKVVNFTELNKEIHINLSYYHEDLLIFHQPYAAGWNNYWYGKKIIFLK